LTSEDLGAYGHDIGVTLPQLLWQLVDVIPEGARMRLGMTNPPYILEHLPVSLIFYMFKIFFQINKECHIESYTASMVEGLETMTSNPVTSLAWVRSPGDALVV
jgi:hypothetical protein